MTSHVEELPQECTRGISSDKLITAATEARTPSVVIPYLVGCNACSCFSAIRGMRTDSVTNNPLINAISSQADPDAFGNGSHGA